jgi:hypothetical protein
MINDQTTEPVFLQTVSVALAQLKQRLQKHYEQAFPGLREIIHLVVDEEERKAWQLSFFPHLLLPDLVEAHIVRLGLQPTEINHAEGLLRPDFSDTPKHQPALALCA